MIGFGKRLSYAFRSFFALAGRGEIPEDIAREVVAAAPQQLPQAAPAPEPRPAPAQPKTVESPDRAVQILALLQRDGRLIDFFTEDISPYSDAQIGAAVRDLQLSCRQSLERYIKLEPVLASEEGQTVTVEPGFSPAAIKLIGNVTGQPPLNATLRHKGWRVTSVTLPPLPEGDARSIIAPAEVEM
ncbi:MAG TPA: DUF2760 domain-containing protein [Blastocatellia bacterium]|nr:DUF2760 domain-containing protein [Blastocatellia bacterium]